MLRRMQRNKNFFFEILKERKTSFFRFFKEKIESIKQRGLVSF